MEITTRADADTKIINLSGTLDSSNVGEFRAKFLEEAGEFSAVILNCSEMEYLDSSGLATLVNVFKNLEARQVRLVICGFSDGTLRVIKFTKLDKVLHLAPSVEDALAEVKS